jgi:hypothetical protein
MIRTLQDRALDLERIRLAAHEAGAKHVGELDVRAAVEAVAAAAAEEALQIALERARFTNDDLADGQVEG